MYFGLTVSSHCKKALNALVADPEDSSRSQRGLEHVRKYSWDSTAEQTLNIYLELAMLARSLVAYSPKRLPCLRAEDVPCEISSIHPEKHLDNAVYWQG